MDEIQASGKGQGDFFAIDRRAWARVCGLGINPAVAYLVLARGTGANNRSSSCAAPAAEIYTTDGKQVYSTMASAPSATINNLPSGILIVKAGSTASKVLVK